MARPKEFNETVALDSAVGVFREHGYAGASASMLVEALGIGRQSLYDTFGDKWQLYLEAVRKYSADEVKAHIALLESASRAMDGIHAMLERVVANAGQACLGVSSICEFGTTRPELSAIHRHYAQHLDIALTGRIRRAQVEGDIAGNIDAAAAAGFIASNIAAIRLAARTGAGRASLEALAALTLRALR